MSLHVHRPQRHTVPGPGLFWFVVGCTAWSGAGVAAQNSPSARGAVQLADDFESGTLRRELWRTRRAAHSVVTVGPGPIHGNALHLRSLGGNVEVITRRRFLNRPLELRFTFVQPAAENQGYAGVVRFSSAYHFWWLEWRPPKLGLWTTSGGEWGCRWSATGLKCDRAYEVTVQNKRRQVRVRVTDTEGRPRADSGWQPHDDGPPGAVAFGAHTGTGLRGIWIDDVVVVGRNEPRDRFLGPETKRNTVGRLVLTEPGLSATFSRVHGWPLTLAARGHDLFGQGLAGGFLREFRSGTFHPYSDGDFRVVTCRREGPTLAITQVSTDRKYTLHTTYGLTADALQWEMTLEARAPQPVEVALGVKVPAADWVERFFMPTADAPFTRQNVPPTFAYRDPVGGSAIPLLTLYSPVREQGLTLAVNPNVPQPAMVFKCSPEGETASVSVLLQHVAVRSGHPVRLVVYLTPHGGDWRPGLDWFQKRFADCFRPRAQVAEGHQIIGGLLHGQRIRQLHDWGFRWVESHFLRCAFYGKYIGEQNTPAEIQGVNTAMGNARRRDWHSYIYWAFVETRPDFAQTFPDSISRSPSGKPHLLGWNKYAWMVPFPGGAWQTYILGQLSALLDAVPEADGVFCDNLLHRAFSYGQRDGLSMVGGKECYQYAFAQEDTLWKAKEMILARAKGLWGNGACDLPTARYLDGILVEGNSLCLRSQQYLGLHKPLVFITYYDKDDPDRAAELEYNLKRALTCGSLLGFNEWELKPEVIALGLLQRYLPLFERLRGRQWVLSPHPLTLPSDTEGNVFRTPGGYTVCLASFAEKDLPPQSSPRRSRLTFTLRLPGVRAVRGVSCCTPETAGKWLPVPRRRAGNLFVVTIPWAGTAAAVFIRTE